MKNFETTYIFGITTTEQITTYTVYLNEIKHQTKLTTIKNQYERFLWNRSYVKVSKTKCCVSSNKRPRRPLDFETMKCSAY